MDLDKLFTITEYDAFVVTIPSHRENGWVSRSLTTNGGAPSPLNNADGNDPNILSCSASTIIIGGQSNEQKGEEDDQEPLQPSTITVAVKYSTAASTDYDLTGQILWPVSMLLGHYIASGLGQGVVKGSNVVELGAGCGFPGLVAAHFADRVVLTDGNDVVMDLLRQNAYSSMHSITNPAGIVTASKFLWGQQADLTRILKDMNGHVDVVIAADVVQWPAVVEPLLHTVKALLWTSRLSRPIFLLGIVNRAQMTYDLFFTLSDKLGFSCQRMSPDVFLKDGLIPKSCQEFGGRSTEIFEVELMDRSVPPVLLDQNQDRTLGHSFENTPFLPC